MSATTLSRPQRPREATLAAGALACDLATREEREHGRERRPEVPTCQVRAAGTTEVVGWRVRGAPGLLALGTVALADAGIGVAVCFVYHQVARRSMLALAAWPTCVGALVLAAAFHGSIKVLALDMVAASAALVVGLGIHSLVSAMLSLAGDTASLPRQAILLEPATVDLMVVAPRRNVGATHLATHLRRICDVLGGAGLAFEVVPVSDRSSDGSERAFDELPGELVRPIVWSDNRGKGGAPGIGLPHGHGRYLGFVDADGDIPADGLAQFVAVVRRQHPDVVVGSKRHPQAQAVYPPLRPVYSTGYQCLTRLLFGLRVRDTQTGVELVRRDVVAEVLLRMAEKRFAFDLGLLAVAHRLGYRQVAELPVVIGGRFRAAWVADGDKVTWLCAAVDGRPSMEQVDGITVVRRGSRHSVYRQARLFYHCQGGGRFALVVDEVNTRPFEAARWAAGTPMVALVYQLARDVWFHELAWPVAAVVGDFFLEPRWGWRADRSTLAKTLWLNSAWNWHGRALYKFAADLHHFRLVLWRYAVPVVAFAALGVAGLWARTRYHQQRLRRGGGSAGGPARPRCRRAVAGVEPDRCSERAGEVAAAGGSGPGGAGVFAGDRAAPAGFDAVRVPVAVSCETRLGASRCVASGRRQTGVSSNDGGRRRAGRPLLAAEQGSRR